MTVGLSAYCQTGSGWSMNPADYSNSMIVVGVLQLDKVESTDAEDEIAAFVGNELRGVANIKYEAALDRYLAFLSVYSNTTGEVVSFKFYDASANAQIDGVTTVEFVNNGLIGVGNTPYVWSNVTLNDQAELLDISFAESNGEADFTGHEVAVPLKYGTDLSALVANFTTSEGATVSIAGAAQETGVTVNDFSAPLTYKVLAEDEQTSEEYVVSAFIKNDSPTDIDLSATSIDENNAVGDVIASITGTDDDEMFTFSLVEGSGDTDNDSFTIEDAELKAGESFDFETKSSYSIRLQVSDVEDQTYEESFTIMINDVNEAPSELTLSALSIDENLPAGTVVGDLRLMDEDNGDSHTYFLSGTSEDNAFFNIDGNQLKPIEALNYESQASYSIEITAEDNGGLMVTEGFTILVIDQNDAPSAISLDVASVYENLPFGTPIGNLLVDDEDHPEVHTLSLVSGDGDDHNDLVFISDKKLNVKQNLDYEATPELSVRVKAVDLAGAAHEEVLSIEVLDILDSDILLSNASFSEGAIVGDTIGMFSVEDETGPFIYSLANGGTDNASFQIKGEYLTLAAKRDFETDHTLLIRVKATDEFEASVTGEFSISVTDANDAPTGIALDNSSVAENLKEGTKVGVLSAIDQDAVDSYEYTLLSDTETFKISGNELQTKGSLNFELQDSYTVEVKVTDGEGEEATESLEISVLDANDVPTAITLSPASLLENLPYGTEIGKFATTDEDAADAYTYQLVIGSGSDHNDYVVVSNDRLLVKESIDYEEITDLSVRVRVTDEAGSRYDEVISIAIGDIFDSDILLSTYEFPESMEVGDTVAQLSIEDKSGAFTYQFRFGDNDNKYFAIKDDYLTLKEALDYELQNDYLVKIRAYDMNSDHVEQQINLTLVDANDAPTDIVISNASVGENLVEGTLVGMLSVEDQDAGDRHFFAILSGSEWFKISGNQLQLRTSLNHEESGSREVEIQVADQWGKAYTETLTIEVVDQNDAPTDITLSSASVQENLPYGTIVGTFSTTDEDDNDQYQYELVSGTGDDHNDFVVITDNKLLLQQPMDYENLSELFIRVKSTDKGAEVIIKQMTIEIIDVLDSDILLSSSSFPESFVSGDTVGMFSVEDQTRSFDYGLISGFNDNAFFSIKGNYLTLRTQLNFENRNEYYVDISAKDNTNSSVSSRLTLYLQDANEAPTELTLTNYSISENVLGGGIIGLAKVTDQDAGDTFKLAIKEGTDNADLFKTDEDGFLWSTGAFNYEEKDHFEVTLIAYDKDSASVENTVVIEVLNQNDAPILNEKISDLVITTNRLTFFEIDENWFADEDEADSLIYNILSTTGDTVEWASVTDDNTTIEFNPRSLGGTNHSFVLVATDYMGAEVKSSFDLEIVVVTSTDALDAELKIYPNPTTNLVSWNENFNPYRVSVYSLEGRLMIRNNNPSGKMKVGDLPEGTYIIELVNDRQTVRSKIVIQ